jgi:hypothetical protein
MTISVQYYLREITCRYQGQVVYKEISGELEGYVPDETWEEKVEEFSSLSRKIEKQQRPIEKRKIAEENQKRRIEILEVFKNKWGLT